GWAAHVDGARNRRNAMVESSLPLLDAHATTRPARRVSVRRPGAGSATGKQWFRLHGVPSATRADGSELVRSVGHYVDHHGDVHRSEREILGHLDEPWL